MLSQKVEQNPASRGGGGVLGDLSSLSAGLVHEDLQTFLLNNVPRGKKKGKVTLGVSDPKLGSVISETLEIHCQTGEHSDSDVVTGPLVLAEN